MHVPWGIATGGLVNGIGETARQGLDGKEPIHVQGLILESCTGSHGARMNLGNPLSKKKLRRGQGFWGYNSVNPRPASSRSEYKLQRSLAPIT
jgi:hypothetical protein